MKMSVTDFKRLNLKKRNKYNNQKTIYNGRQYDSKKEAKRAFELDLLLKANVLTSWSAQPEFKIEYQGVHICTYRGDFRLCFTNGLEEIEDVKSVATKTPIYRLKKKLVKAFYNIDIKEI